MKGGVFMVNSLYTEQLNIDLLNVDQLCQALSIGTNTAYALLNSGDIHAFRIGRTWRIPSVAVNEFILRKANITNVSA